MADVTRMDLIEIDGTHWCVAHDGLWHEPESECDRTWIDKDLGRPAERCVDVPLFRGLAEHEASRL